MAKKDESFGAPGEKDRTGFVPAVFARSIEGAEIYQELLGDHDIPAIIGSDEDLDEAKRNGQGSPERGQMSHGVPVLVPEVLLDEASEIIADREDTEEFEDDEDDYDDEDDDEEPDAGDKPILDDEDDIFEDDEPDEDLDDEP
ncbi:MAG: hypothetical protein KAU28_09975 [Phycisphaerae bacterium]|nr:hypothetical protein [Phycisphaerae bacterium]